MLFKRLLFLLGAAIVAVGGQAAGSSKDIYLECLSDFQRYGDSIWKSAGYSNAPADSGYWGDGASTGNGGIRGNCGVAVAYATLVVASPGAPENSARLAKIRQALHYAANTHLSGTNICNDGKKWGRGWQSGLWAGSMGLACMLVETQLPPATVAHVKRALADEASYRATVPPASGYVGDTKAEENGWNANVVALAAAWLRQEASATNWLRSAKEYLANTYTVADTQGDPLASWITTTTLYPDFSLENHGFYHPTYQMVSGMSMGDSLLMADIADSGTAADLRPFAEHNVLNVWSNLNHLLLDSGELAYPSGLDWELHDFEHNSYIAWLASHFNDPLARHADEQLAKLVRYRQVVNKNGRFVGESVSNGFFREAVEARRTAIAWLHWDRAAYPSGPSAPPAPDVAHYTNVSIISHRSASGFASISFGTKIMAVIEPLAASVPTNAFMTTPRHPGLIGLGALGNPAGATLLALSTNSAGFAATLRVTNASGFTDVYVRSAGSAIGIVEVPNPPAGFIPSTAGSFTMGIENDPLTGGTRLLQSQGVSVTVTNRSGGAARILPGAWLCVDNRYGVSAGPEGQFSYQPASSYNRPGAAQDTLQWNASNPVAARYAVWSPR